jgi:hypothetical protein
VWDMNEEKRKIGDTPSLSVNVGEKEVILLQ